MVPDDAEVVDICLDMAEQVTRLSPFGIQHDQAGHLGQPRGASLRAAIDLEDRNQLLAGYTGNLDEAMAAFREKRKPVYRD